jgi:hypothetical protein
MSDRKYRQRGYQDEPRERQPRRGPEGKPAEKPPGAPRGQSHLAPKTYNMPGFREVMRCARCGNQITPPIGSVARCNRCGADLHACVNCVSFDSGARWECSEHARITARVPQKDGANDCQLFTARTTVERETHSQPQTESGSSARKAFDDLFK